MLNLRAERQKLADRLVKQCLGVKSTDAVSISTTKQTIDLADEISLKCFEAGADVLLNLYTDPYYRGYMTLLSEESLREPSKFCTAFTETSTVEVILGWLDDPRQLQRVPREKFAAYSEGEHKAHWPLQKQRRIRIANLSMLNVTPQRAKAYRLGYEGWLRAGYRAAAVDYAELNRIGKKVAAALEGTERVHVTAEVGGTDVWLSLAGRKPLVNDGVIDDEDGANENFETSIPAGEVTVVPLEDSAEGSFSTDLPLLFRGSRPRFVRWGFARGRMTGFGVGSEGRLLKEEYARAKGDRDRVGYLQIGINPKAVFGYMFDPLVQGAVTLGIGGNEIVGGQNRSTFSAHATLKRASVEADGTTIVDSGKLAVV